jgi:hypothetical protein
MNKITKILAVGIIPFLVQGCSGTTASSNAVTPQDASKPNSATPPAAQVPPSQATSPIAPITVNTTIASPTNPQFSGLIASTNSELRVQGVVKGRNDPFALFPVQGKLKKVDSKENKTNAEVKKVTEVKTAKVEPKVTKAVSVPKKPVIPTATTTTNKPKVVNTPQSKPVIPTSKKPAVIIPQPELARAVEVTGVIDIEGNLMAILKSPNELTSQYVREGQHIANGRILVKRIIAYPEASVVLEQKGIKGNVIKGIMESSPVAQNNTPSASYMFVENRPQ